MNLRTLILLSSIIKRSKYDILFEPLLYGVVNLNFDFSLKADFSCCWKEPRGKIRLAEPEIMFFHFFELFDLATFFVTMAGLYNLFLVQGRKS